MSYCHACFTIVRGNARCICFIFRYNNFYHPLSAACAFITRDQQLSSSKAAVGSGQTSHSQIQSSSTTFLSSAGGRSRLPFEDVSKRQNPVQICRSRHLPKAMRLPCKDALLPVDCSMQALATGKTRNAGCMLASGACKLTRQSCMASKCCHVSCIL